jgi:hypothetical protein
MTNKNIISLDIISKINKISQDKEIEYLHKFIKNIEDLNYWNSYSIYVYHLIQSSGLIISSYGTSEKNTTILWTGIGLNMLASIIHIYEKINNGKIKKLKEEIKQIKNRTFESQQSLINIDDNITPQNILENYTQIHNNV